MCVVALSTILSSLVRLDKEDSERHSVGMSGVSPNKTEKNRDTGIWPTGFSPDNIA